MKIALVSDIHGNLAALEAVIEDIHCRGVDCVVNLGDSLSGPLLPFETAQCLMSLDWLSIAGNHERQLLTQKPDRMGPSDRYAHSKISESQFCWLRSLPPSARIGADVYLCHGTPSSDIEYFLETAESGLLRAARQQEIESRLGTESASLIARGHTHIPRVARTRQGQIIVNPGSVGLPAYEDSHPFAHAVENGSPDARYAIVEKSVSGWVVSLLSVPYDYQSMANLAKLHGRPDWERALLTGYMS